jgi:hypothetical protein
MPESQLSVGIGTPGFPALADILGANFIFGSRGFVPTASGTGVFGPDFTTLRRALQTLIGQQPTRAEQLGRQFAGELGPETFQPTLDLFAQDILPGARELARTGLPTDLSPIIAQRKRAFKEDFLPSLAERVSPTFSGFGELGAREASRLSTELGQLQVGLSEAAAHRRAAGLPLAAQLGAAGAALPGNIITDLLGLGGALRQTGPERSIVDLFLELSGLPIQAGFGTVTSDTSTDKFLKGSQGFSNIFSSLFPGGVGGGSSNSLPGGGGGPSSGGGFLSGIL